MNDFGTHHSGNGTDDLSAQAFARGSTKYDEQAEDMLDEEDRSLRNDPAYQSQ